MITVGPLGSQTGDRLRRSGAAFRRSPETETTGGPNNSRKIDELKRGETPVSNKEAGEERAEISQTSQSPEPRVFSGLRRPAAAAAGKGHEVHEGQGSAAGGHRSARRARRPAPGVFGKFPRSLRRSSPSDASEIRSSYLREAPLGCGQSAVQQRSSAESSSSSPSGCALALGFLGGKPGFLPLPRPRGSREPGAGGVLLGL